MEGASLTSFSPSVLILSHMHEQGGGSNETGLYVSAPLTYSYAFCMVTDN